MRNGQLDSERARLIGGKMFDASHEATTRACNMQTNVPEAVYTGIMCGLGGLTVAAALVGKQPDGITEDSSREEQVRAEVGMINKDTVLLAALLAYHTFSEARVADNDKIAKAIDTEFGPPKIYEAVEDWKKLTGKSPDGYFLPNLIAAANEAGANSEKPFAVFLEGRRNQLAPGSGSVQ